MRFERLEIPEVVLCTPRILRDERGYFFESFRKDLLENFLGFSLDFCQENESYSTQGVFRGLHYQIPPFAQSKWVSVLEGAIMDILVDIRTGSPTFGKSLRVLLNGEGKQRLFIPRGFAHGFLVLSPWATLKYYVDNYYSPAHDQGIFYKDPTLNIDLGVPHHQIKISERDKKFPLLENAVLFDCKENLYPTQK